MSRRTAPGVSDHQNHQTGDQPQGPQKSLERDLQSTSLVIPKDEQIEIIERRWRRDAQIFEAACLNSYRVVDPNHACARELSNTVRWAAEQLGIPPDGVSVHAFQSYPRCSLNQLSSAEGSPELDHYLPQAFVLAQTGTVFVNVPLLQTLEWSPPLVNAVLYHEVAHLQYQRRLSGEISARINDPFRSRLESYEIEYHCDRLAAILSSKRGEDPRSIAIALQALQDFEREFIEKWHIRPEAHREIDLLYLSTHPATPRRIRANEIVSRNLSNKGETPSSKLPIIGPKELPIHRPFGSVVSARNSFGLTSEDVFDVDDVEPPLAMGDLLKKMERSQLAESRALQTDLVSDWFVSLCGILGSEDGLQFKKEFIEDELSGDDAPTLDDLQSLLKGINLARVLDNEDFCDLSIVQDARLLRSLGHAADLLVNRYIEVAREDRSPLEVLEDLMQIADYGDRQFGVSAVFCGERLVQLCAEISDGGKQEDTNGLARIIDSNSHLSQLIAIYRELRREHPTLHELLAEHQKRFNLIPRYSQENSSLRAHSLEVWLGAPLSSQDICELPICVRRVPGGSFSVTKQVLRDGREYHLVLIGDNRITDSDEHMLKTHLQESVETGLVLLAQRMGVSRQDLSGNHARYLKNIDDFINNINTVALTLAPLEPKSAQEKREFLVGLCAEEFGRSSNNRTARALTVGESITSDDKVDARILVDIELREMIEGTRQVQEDLIGLGRHTFTETRYARAEERSTLHLEHTRLWHEVFGDQYASMQTGLERALFLAETYPMKTLYRDQLICESLGLPSLACLDDMKNVAQAIQGENSLDRLLFIRDHLHNQALAQMVEVRLFELFESDQDAFLRYPAITSRYTQVLSRLPEELRRIVDSEERLLGVLLCFDHASRERDRHLGTFRDHANNRQEKESLGALFSDPNLVTTSASVSFEARQDADVIFSLLGQVTPYDKAQALLYFMGQRSFGSPLERGFTRDAPFEGDESSKILPEKNLTNWQMPDIVVRAQKAFGISITTAENLQAGLLNERTVTDLLSEALYGTNGIASSPKLSKQFFQLAGQVLTRENPQLSKLAPGERQKIERFLGFAFQNCPASRLPSVILKVWEATKGGSKDMPSLAATVLGKLGPAFVKFGQRLSALDIDAEYKRAFRALCSENAQVDTSFVYHNLGVICPPRTFDESRTGRKIAEGSMAATYHGTLQGSGEQVSVKIIHPHIKGSIDEDVEYIRKIVEYLNNERPFPKLLIPDNTPDIIRQQLETQTDSIREMNRADALRNALTPRVRVANFVVPAVKREASGDGAIVSSYMPGYELDKSAVSETGLDAQAIRNAVGLEVLRMLLEERCFQSDVNLGNFGVLKDADTGAIERDSAGLPTVVWYDPGAVEDISEDDQKLLLKVLMAAQRDPAGIPDLVSQMVQGVEGKAEEIRRICSSFGTKTASKGSIALADIQGYFNEFLDDLSGAGFVVQDKWLIIANTLSTVAPLLQGASEADITKLVTGALEKHKMLGLGARLFTRITGWSPL